MMGPTGPRRLRLAIEHLAHVRGSSCYFIDLDPRWVKKLISQQAIRRGEGIHGARRRSGRDDPEAPQSERALHHAEAARGARGEGGHLRGRHPRRLLRRHHDAAAIRALHRRGSARRAHRLLPDLRQHAHGPRRQRAAHAGGQFLDHLLRAAAARRAARGRSEGHREDRGLRHVGPRRADHADQGILHAALPRARRSAPPQAARALRVGRRRRSAARSARWRRRSSKAFTDPGSAASIHPHAHPQKSLRAGAGGAPGRAKFPTGFRRFAQERGGLPGREIAGFQRLDGDIVGRDRV